MKSMLGLRDGIKFWTRERDPLVEETLSFVKGISASRPAEPEQNVKRVEIVLTKRPDSDFMISERAEFRRRVVEFRARQHRIRQGREQYYAETREKTRLALGT
jgi:hypothetical protein